MTLHEYNFFVFCYERLRNSSYHSRMPQIEILNYYHGLFFQSIYFYVCRSFSSRSKWTGGDGCCVYAKLLPNQLFDFFGFLFFFALNVSNISRSQTLTDVNWEWHLTVVCSYPMNMNEYPVFGTELLPEFRRHTASLRLCVVGFDAKIIPSTRSGAEISYKVYLYSTIFAVTSFVNYFYNY